MSTLFIDPGDKESGFAIMDGLTIRESGKTDNRTLRTWISRRDKDNTGVKSLVVEMVACYGMPVGAEVFETCVWIGRFIEAFNDELRVDRMLRNEVKMALCHRTAKVNDSVIRQRIIDIYGGKESAIGNVKKPGPLHKVKGDVWQAIALGVAWDMKSKVAA